MSKCDKCQHYVSVGGDLFDCNGKVEKYNYTLTMNDTSYAVMCSDFKQKEAENVPLT